MHGLEDCFKESLQFLSGSLVFGPQIKLTNVSPERGCKEAPQFVGHLFYASLVKLVPNRLVSHLNYTSAPCSKITD